MKAALKDAVERIKEAGFSHIKVELEADIGRDGNRDCDGCEGSGQTTCDNCHGDGVVYLTDESGNEYEPECANCYGDGSMDCSDCEGEGNTGNFMDEDTCGEFMRNWVEQRHPEVASRLTYGRFYEDGSVDSEFTFTVPIDNVEDVVIWMESFKALADECGKLDTSGAGLHISVLPRESNGHYPVPSRTLNTAGVRNFESEVTKLLPALFFLASSDHKSRDLGYRHARIGGDKYNAVSHHERSCFEFRVFETCYNKTEVFFDYVQTIANCLKFYADPTLKVNALGKQFGFNDGDQLARFYDTPEQLRILSATVKHLKPKDKSFKALKQERGIHYTIAGLKQQEKTKAQRLRQEYREYRARWQAQANRPLTEADENDIRYYMQHEGMSRDEAITHIRRPRQSLKTLAQFIQDNLSMRYDEQVAV